MEARGSMIQIKTQEKAED